jgi:hypothetical protein
VAPGPSDPCVLSTDALREHWQGHRRVTRRVIDAFPGAEVFQYSIGGMRPFADMAFEMISMAQAGIQGIATGDWSEKLMHHSNTPRPASKDALLGVWDDTTALIDRLWPGIPPARFLEVDKAFGVYEGQIAGLLLYWIDNEIHHRGQGYVYLRSLGIEPPAFYDRS